MSMLAVIRRPRRAQRRIIASPRTGRVRAYLGGVAIARGVLRDGGVQWRYLYGVPERWYVEEGRIVRTLDPWC